MASRVTVRARERALPQPKGTPRAHSNSIWLLAVLGVASAAVWITAVALARAGWNPLGVYNGAFAGAFALYLVACAVVLRRGLERTPLVTPTIVAVAIVARLILVVSQPALSDDLYRYVWDGKVQAAGINPYRYAPDAPQLAFLRDDLWPPINQKWQRTPYPPAAELVFAATYQVVGPSLKAHQVLAALADAAVIAALLVLLARLKLPSERVLVYAWSPLPILHFAHSAHNDALMVAPLLLALVLAAGSRPARAVSGAALAFAAAIKLLPLLLLPALLRRWRQAGAVAFALTMLALVAPYAGGGSAVLGGLGAEAGQAVFNDSVHYVLVRAVGPVTGSPSTAVTLMSAVILGATALGLAWRAGDDAEALARIAWVLLGLALLLNAVVEPWYLTWMLPFVALYLRTGRAKWPFALTPALGWLWLSGAVQLTDLQYAGLAGPGVWPLIRVVEYGPLVGLLALGGGRWALATRARCASAVTR